MSQYDILKIFEENRGKKLTINDICEIYNKRYTQISKHTIACKTRRLAQGMFIQKGCLDDHRVTVYWIENGN